MLIILLIAVGEINAKVFYTISGMSSGGYMAGQIHVAYSSYISGAGIIVAGPYYCALDSLLRANTICTYNNNPVDITEMVNYTIAKAAQGLIDPIEDLANTTVYIFAGMRDELMQPAILEATYNYYKTFIPESKITYVKNPYSNHAWPTKISSNPCWYYGRNFINNCGFDGSGIILTTLLGPLFQKGVTKTDNLYAFPQKAYANVAKIYMDDYGYIYIPDTCKSDATKCRLHVNLHGCGQNHQNMGFNFILGLGLIEWADTNNIVVIFPQTINSIYTSSGCWDLSGYNGPDYALKSGGQVLAVHTFTQNYAKIVSDLFK